MVGAGLIAAAGLVAVTGGGAAVGAGSTAVAVREAAGDGWGEVVGVGGAAFAPPFPETVPGLVTRVPGKGALAEVGLDGAGPFLVMFPASDWEAGDDCVGSAVEGLPPELDAGVTPWD